MSREEDVLFCKLAISSGLVKETDAHKVLSLCEKKERETGRRPMIGSVFEKYNLLGKPDVQRVYQAIQKRTGATVETQRRASAEREKAGSSRAAGMGGGRRRAQAHGDAPKAKVDQNALILGVVSMIVVLGVLVFLFVQLNKKPQGAASRTAETKAEAPATPGAAATPASASSGTPATLPTAAGGTKPASHPTAKEPKTLSRDQLQEVNSAIADIRGTYADHPADGLLKLEAQRKKIADSNSVVPENLLAAIQQFETMKKDAEASGSRPDPAPVPAPPEEAKPEPEPEPAEEPEPETPADTAAETPAETAGDEDAAKSDAGDGAKDN